MVTDKVEIHTNMLHFGVKQRVDIEVGGSNIITVKNWRVGNKHTKFLEQRFNLAQFSSDMGNRTILGFS